MTLLLCPRLSVAVCLSAAVCPRLSAAARPTLAVWLSVTQSVTLSLSAMHSRQVLQSENKPQRLSAQQIRDSDVITGVGGAKLVPRAAADMAVGYAIPVPNTSYTLGTETARGVHKLRAHSREMPIPDLPDAFFEASSGTAKCTGDPMAKEAIKSMQAAKAPLYRAMWDLLGRDLAQVGRPVALIDGRHYDFFMGSLFTLRVVRGTMPKPPQQNSGPTKLGPLKNFKVDCSDTTKSAAISAWAGINS